MANPDKVNHRGSTVPSVSRGWRLTDHAFEKLLTSLSPDREEAGNRYELLRRKLIRFCESNLSFSVEDKVDEIINRLTRKIEEGAEVSDVFAYAYGIAKMVQKEAWKESDRKRQATETLSSINDFSRGEGEDPKVLCFDTCLERLSAENRKLILDYYRDDRRAKIDLRKELAEELSIPLNALRIRAHRVRKFLEECVTDCLAA